MACTLHTHRHRHRHKQKAMGTYTQLCLRQELFRKITKTEKPNDKMGNKPKIIQLVISHVSARAQKTYSLWTRWLRRSCVISSCQDFLKPAAEGGVAVGMEPRLPTPSFIKLEERTDQTRGGEKRQTFGIADLVLKNSAQSVTNVCYNICLWYH